jgi:Tfp pilus assembly protein PilF
MDVQPARRNHLTLLIASMALSLLLCSSDLSAAVWLTAITGTALDETGNPLASALLRFTDPANGRSFEVTSNAEGRFSYIAVQPSHYRLEVIRPRHHPLTFSDVFLDWSSEALLLSIDLRTNSVKVTRQVMLQETFVTEPPTSTLPIAENSDAAVARAINDRLSAARRYIAAADWASAISAAKSATEIDPNRDLPWAWLANVYCSEAQHTSTPPADTLNNCIKYYGYAIAIAPSPPYLNNVGVAYTRLGDWDKAAENFRAALQPSPDNAALYHLNLGAMLLKQSEASADIAPSLLQAARDEFAAAATATPAINEAYYWKGLCELRLAANGVDGMTYQMVRESLAHYLQLVSQGHHVLEAQAILEGLNESRLKPTKGQQNP